MASAELCHEKLRFVTQREAQAAATTLAHQRGALLKPYRCRQCSWWHLTSV